jgi:pilus assembly protein FimV
MRSSTMKILSASLLVAALMLFPADGLRALGLGEARVDSYLGQTLDVSIRLIEPDGGALDSLTVASASGDDYDRLGIPSTALALGLDVSVDRRVDPPLLRVRSSREVIDPVIQILVDARWSSGRVLREYTLFLDPPTLPVAPPIRRVEEVSEAPEPDSRPLAVPEPAPAPRPAPATREPEPEIVPAVEPVTEPSEPMARPAQPIAPSSSARTVGPVAAGQTLWGIAYAWRPSSGLTMNQVMLAILDRNPRAFIDGNVNQLRRDAMLEMPTSDEMASIDPSEADRRMRAQMQAWQPGTAVAEVPVISDDAVPEVMAESELDPVEDVDDDDYRLEVVPPEGEVDDEVPAVSEVEVAQATSRLTDLEDQFYAEGLENDALYRQVEEIRDAIESRDLAGMAVANEQLANLEARLREAREARALEEELSAAAEAEEPPVDEVDEYFQELEGELGLAEQDAGEVGDASDADSGMSDTEEGTPAETEQAVADTDDIASLEDSEPTSTMPVTRTARDDGLPSWIYILILGGVAVLAGAAYYLFGIRRTSSEETPRGDAGPSIDAARERVIEQRGDLDAHLALLNVLADRGDENAFSDALDGMYAEVDDEEDPRWQEALNLAVLNAPDHPLLTPRETGLVDDDADEGLDDRTREMLGLFDEKDQGSNASETVDDYEIDSSLDLAENDRASDDEEDADDFFASLDDEDDEKRSEEDEFTAASTDTIVLGDADMDLADLSDRLDEESRIDLSPSSRDLEDKLSPEGDAPELGGAVSDEGSSIGEDSDLNLDFEFSGGADEDDSLTADEAPESDADKASPADTLDLSNQSASNDTLRMDPDELRALSETADAAKENAPETVRADDTLDLVSQDIDFEDVGDRELEAFLAEGDESDGTDAGSEDDERSILDSEDGEDEAELSDEDADVKLDLARAYISMDDPESARTLLEEIVNGGSSAKRSQARELLDGL